MNNGGIESFEGLSPQTCDPPQVQRTCRAMLYAVGWWSLIAVSDMCKVWKCVAPCIEKRFEDWHGLSLRDTWRHGAD